MEQTKNDRIEALLSNAKLGTTLLAIIKLQNEKGYAKNTSIVEKVFSPKKYKKNDSKVAYYIDTLGNFPINFIDFNGKPFLESYTLIEKKEHGIYSYNEKELIDFLISALKSLSVDYTKPRFKDIFKSKEVKEGMLNYIVNYAKKEMKNDELYSISDILTNLELHLVVLHYEKKIKNNEDLTKWAEELVNEEKENLFLPR